MARQTRNDPIKDTASYMLQVVSRLQTATFCSYIDSTGVHPAESFVLLELWREEPLSQTQISQRLDIGNATVGQTLKRLEKNGFVKRQPCTEDRRRLLVYLTDSGRALQAPITQASSEIARDIKKLLGKEDSEHLLASLTKLADYFREKQA